MCDADELQAALGQDVELVFSDGAVVQAQLLLLILHEPQRLIFRVRKVLAPVPGNRSGLIVTAGLVEVKAWKVI